MKNLNIARGYKTVKVPTWVYENAKLLQEDLVRKGTQRIPTELLAKAPYPLFQRGITLSDVLVLSVLALQEGAKKP